MPEIFCMKNFHTCSLYVFVSHFEFSMVDVIHQREHVQLYWLVYIRRGEADIVYIRRGEADIVAAHSPHVCVWLMHNPTWTTEAVKLCPLGQVGKSRFTVVSLSTKCASVCIHPCLCQSLFTWYFLQGVIMFQNELCLRNISYSFVPMAFKFLHMVTMDKTLTWLTFYDYGLIFKVTGSLCFKINFVYVVFPVVLCRWLAN